MKTLYSATGRRKTSVAQVKLLPGNGKIFINKREPVDYLPVEINRVLAFRALDVTGTAGKYDVNVTVRGGGITGQTGAIQLGVARALVKIDENFRAALREAGLLTRDPRAVERKKYGQKKARKRFQFSKR